MKSNIYKLEFDTYNFTEDPDDVTESKISDHYKAILKEYFKEVHGRSDCKIEILRNDGRTTGDNFKVNEFLSQNPYFKVEIKVLGIKTDFYEFAAKFYMYPQNNCCGAMSVSGTQVSDAFSSRKLGNILQSIKEDIGYMCGVSLLTATDIYYQGTKSDADFKKLKPYLKNTRLMMKHGWVASDMFFNKKSNNVVALFTKKLDKYKSDKSSTHHSYTIPTVLASKKISNIMVGGDPEVFLRSLKTGKYVPSFDYIKGEKGDPTPISKDGHAIQIDNTSLEYNFPPCKTEDEFVKNNLFVQNYITNTIAEPNGLELSIVPYAVFDKNTLEHPKAKTFGCDVDFNVWDQGRPNEVGGTSGNGRSGGGHIHFSYDGFNPVTSLNLIKMFDLFISVPLVLMEPDNKRKTMYGKAGCYRLTRFGFEYRTTSNFIYSSEKMMRCTYQRIEQLISEWNRTSGTIIWDCNHNSIISAINENNKIKAKELVDRFKIPLLTVKKGIKCAD